MTAVARFRSKTKGFTLLEMLVILAILSLIAGIVFPSLDKAMRRQTFVDSKVRFELGLRAARALAVRGGAPVRVGLAPGRHGLSYGATTEMFPTTTAVTLPISGIAFFADGSARGGDAAIRDVGLTQRWRIRSATGAIERLP